MNKIFKHKILAGAMLFGFMLAGSSCEDTLGINVTPETPCADMTLYDVLKKDTELSDFVAVLDSCGAHCADSLFNKSRVYTLWAPVNGSFNLDSILEQLAADETGVKPNRDIVFHTFVKAHIANRLIAANGKLDDDNSVLLLNNKNASFIGDHKKGYKFAGSELMKNEGGKINYNIRVWNGLIHKIKTPSEYKYSIWEYLKIAENVDSVATFLYSHDITKFNPDASIPGPVIDQQQTYLDSVFTTSNSWLSSWANPPHNWGGVGNLNSEDSSYVVYVPSNKMWTEMVAKAEKYFAYDLGYDATTPAMQQQMKARDSLRTHYVRFHNLKYITFSNNEQKFVESSDSLMPAYRSVARRPIFAKKDLDKYVISERELSNGTFKVVDAMPYAPTDLWHDTIFLECENSSMWGYASADKIPLAISTISVNKNDIIKDSLLAGAEVSGSNYFYYESKEEPITTYFKLPKVLAAKYNVAFIVVPRHITNPDFPKEQLYPSRFTVTITQELSSGIDTLIETNKKNLYVTNPLKLDTIFLMQGADTAEIEFKACEFYDAKSQADYRAQFDIRTNTGRGGTDMSMRLDKIILIPVADTE